MASWPSVGLVREGVIRHVLKRNNASEGIRFRLRKDVFFRHIGHDAIENKLIAVMEEIPFNPLISSPLSDHSLLAWRVLNDLINRSADYFFV